MDTDNGSADDVENETIMYNSVPLIVLLFIANTFVSYSFNTISSLWRNIVYLMYHMNDVKDTLTFFHINLSSSLEKHCPLAPKLGKKKLKQVKPNPRHSPHYKSL